MEITADAISSMLEKTVKRVVVRLEDITPKNDSNFDYLKCFVTDGTKRIKAIVCNDKKLIKTLEPCNIIVTSYEFAGKIEGKIQFIDKPTQTLEQLKLIIYSFTTQQHQKSVFLRREQEQKKKAQSKRRRKQAHDALMKDCISVKLLNPTLQNWKIFVKLVKINNKVFVNSLGKVTQCEILEFMDKDRTRIEAVRFPQSSAITISQYMGLNTFGVITSATIKQNHISKQKQFNYSPFVMVNYVFNQLDEELLEEKQINRFAMDYFCLLEIATSCRLNQYYNTIAILTGIQQIDQNINQYFKTEDRHIRVNLYDPKNNYCMDAIIHYQVRYQQLKQLKLWIGRTITLCAFRLQKINDKLFLMATGEWMIDKSQLNLQSTSPYYYNKFDRKKYSQKTEQLNPISTYESIEKIDTSAHWKKTPLQLSWSQTMKSDAAGVYQQLACHNSENHTGFAYACLDLEINVTEKYQWTMQPHGNYSGFGLCQFINGQFHFSERNGCQGVGDAMYIINTCCKAYSHAFQNQCETIDLDVSSCSQITMIYQDLVLTFIDSSSGRIHRLTIPDDAEGSYYPIAVMRKGSVSIGSRAYHWKR